MRMLLTSFVFAVLAILMFTGFTSHIKDKKKKWMYLAFSIISLTIAILLFIYR